MSRQTPTAVFGPWRRPRNDEILLLEAIDEPAQQPHPDFVLANRIFNAVFKAGIVVDFHDDNGVGGLFEVDAVEAVAERPRGAHRHLDHLGRLLSETEGAKAALSRRAVRPVLDHLAA